MKASWQVGMKMAKMSPQKYYKLKPILMTLQATLWSIMQVLITISLLFFPLHSGQLYASVLPYLGIILSAFSLNNSKPFFKKVRTVAVQKWNISKDICDCLLVSSSNFLIQPLSTAVHALLYVHIRFRTFRIVIRRN